MVGTERYWRAAGTPGNRITIRAYQPTVGSAVPERVIIQAASAAAPTNNRYATMYISGHDTIYQDLEVTSSTANVDRVSSQTGSAATDITISDNIKIISNVGSTHNNISIVNCILHDNYQGFAPQNPTGVDDADNLEFYGNIDYYNGSAAPDRGHGHGVYSQMQTSDTRSFKDNMLFHNGNYGFQSYGSSDAYGNNITFDGNIIWGNSDIPEVGGGGGSFVISGTSPAFNDTITNNVFYSSSTSTVGQSNWSCGPTCSTGSVFQGNYSIGNWSLINIAVPSGFTLGGAGPLANTMIYNNLTGFTTANYPLNTWSTPISSYAGATKVIVRANTYQAGRGHVMIHNPSLASTVAVDLSTVINSGDSYEVRFAMNYYGTPVLSGTYAGGTVNFPMTSGGGLVNSAPVSCGNPTCGWSTPPAYFPLFAAFVVLRTSTGATPTPTSTNTLTPTPTLTPTFTPSLTKTNTPVASSTPTATAVATNTPTFTPSPSPTPTPTPAVGGTSFSIGICPVSGVMTKTNDVTALGGVYASSSAANNGKLACTFSVPSTGAYRLWVLANNNHDGLQGGNSDGLFEDLDGDSLPNGMTDGDVTNPHIFDMSERQQPCTDDGSGVPVCDFTKAWVNGWVWQILNDRSGTCGSCTSVGTERRMQLTAGQHTLSFRGREISTGEGARVAYLIFTTDLTYNPAGSGATPTPTPGGPTPIPPTPGQCPPRWIQCHGQGHPVQLPCDFPRSKKIFPCPW
jgi:hypothetical protein